MATIDPISNVVVIRVVYDGPPLAGKTTSVRSLAQGLGGRVIVPAEVDGRTVFFDWLDYTGGLFEGRSIRCQIISVPGQASLASRRRHLLSGADVVVFVGDSTRDAQDTVRRYLQSLVTTVEKTAGPPVGIVLQANKRDHQDAMPLAEMRQMLVAAGLNVAIVESVATEGSGIREAFVFAVRLALDRVRELIRLDGLPNRRPDVDTADDLLNSLRSLEGGTLTELPGTQLVHTRLSDVRPAGQVSTKDLIGQTVRQSDALQAASAPVREVRVAEVPRLPGRDVPSGMIWPPVEGRVMLHEVMESDRPLTVATSGNWAVPGSSDWIVQSPASGCFSDLDAGRAALLNWARAHASSSRVLSHRRCIVLASDGLGQYRLWQCIRTESSLLGDFRRALSEGAGKCASALIELVNQFALATLAWPSANCRLPLGIQTMMSTPHGPRFIGEMPYPTIAPSDCAGEPVPVVEWLRSELGFAREALQAMRDDLLTSVASRSHGKSGAALNYDIVHNFLTRAEPFGETGGD